MANLAQVVNVLQSVLVTDGAAVVKTPTYHAFALHRPHMGAQALEVDVAGPELRSGGRAVSATASSTDAGTAVTIVNRDFRSVAEVEIHCPGDMSWGLVLTADTADAVNSVQSPDLVSPRALEVRRTASGASSATIPAHSMATIQYSQRAL
jgi:alpha-N-arabinofuranosidase